VSRDGQPGPEAPDGAGASDARASDADASGAGAGDADATGADATDAGAADGDRTDAVDAAAPDGQDGNADGAADAGVDGGPQLPGSCPASAVSSCPPLDSGSLCEETFCGGRLWTTTAVGSPPAQTIPYRILDPEGKLSASDRAAIRASAAAWSNATSGLLTFQDCDASCAGRFISVVPGDGDGVTNPGDPEELLPMPADAGGGRVSPHRIAHQWGHVVGLAHTYQRADRDRHVRFDPALWCGPGGPGLPLRCAASPSGPVGAPSIASDTFGPFDGRSKMNGLNGPRADGVCGPEEPDQGSGEPTLGDASAAEELFQSQTGGWSPFLPIARSPSPTEPLDYQLAPGVDPVGSPAIAEQTVALPEIFVRGTDDRVYATRRDPTAPAPTGWTDWTPVASDVDSDPAAGFGDADTLYLTVRSRVDGTIQLRARSSGAWGAPASLGMPAAGAASAPGLAVLNAGSLNVFVRGGDGLIYGLDCPDAAALCAGSAAQAGAWSALAPPPSGGVFVGKPSAAWLFGGNRLELAAVSDGRVPLVNFRIPSGWGPWLPIDGLDPGPDDPRPGVTVATLGLLSNTTFFARNRQGILFNSIFGASHILGGVLASPPAVVGVIRTYRTDVAALIDDHGHPGVWWKFSDASYTPPCNYNMTGTCAQCGCDQPGQPSCDL
jgi:hypothetical protein